MSAEKRSEYREVVAFCMDETGKQMGNKFPENINDKYGDTLCTKYFL